MSENHGLHLQEEAQLRRGPWTLEEDSLLVHYIASYGEGRWNHLARSSGLKRTGKSCRLRWLNYLKPDVKRGNLTLDEQLLIIELHSKWGNRWSRIAQQLPGRTDNEIKNYWRTRVQKQTRQLGKEPNYPPVLRTIENPNCYRCEEALSSASQPLLGDACSWSDLYFSPQKFLSPPSIISDVCSPSSNGQYDVGNCFWTVDPPLEIKRLN